MKIVPYFALGQFSMGTLATSAGAAPARDRHQFSRPLAGAPLPAELFYKIAYVLVFVISLR